MHLHARTLICAYTPLVIVLCPAAIITAPAVVVTAPAVVTAAVVAAITTESCTQDGTTYKPRGHTN